jgi:hypothetical protein
MSGVGARRQGDSIVVDPALQVQIPINAKTNQNILVRALNAAYNNVRLTFPVDIVIIAWDGRALGVPPFGSYNAPVLVSAGTPMQYSVARRFDCLIRRTTPFTGFATVEFLDTRGLGVRFTARFPINIAAAGPQPGADTVAITRARYNFNARRGTGSLDLRATSNQAGVVLSASGTGFANQPLVNGRLRLTLNVPSPFPITVTSTGGGSATTEVPI